MKRSTANWKFMPGPMGGGNHILEGDGFCISFNSRPGNGISFFESDEGGSETALCKDDEYRILNGDWRKEYEELVPKGWDACLAFYEAHKDDAGSSWTTPDVS